MQLKARIEDKTMVVCVNAYTGVIGQGGLVRVALLFESHVPQLQHGRHHLQQA